MLRGGQASSWKSGSFGGFPGSKQDRAGFPFCKPLHYSAREDRGRAALDDSLREAIQWMRARQGHAKIGIGRLKVRRRLEKLRAGDAQLPPADRKYRVLTKRLFEEICEEAENVSSPAHLLTYLHECGVVFHRSDIFDDAIVLDQEWALEAIYTVFNRDKCWKQLRQLHGRFNRNLLATLAWTEYEENEQELFISMMQSAGICFVHREADKAGGRETEYVAPDLLPDEGEITEELAAIWQEGEAVKEETIEFPFEHPGLVRSLIARIGRAAGMNAVYWNNGVCGYEQRTGSAIRIESLPPEDPESYQLRIRLQTQRGRAAELLADAIEWVRDEARNSGCRSLDSLPCPHSSRREYPSSSLKEALDDEDEEQRTPEPQFGSPPKKTKTYCVSYAWTEESAQFVDQLCDDAKARDIEIIRDKTHLGLGERISKFMQRLGQGDRVFVILSKKYLESPFCMFELLEIWRRSQAEENEFLKRIRVYRLPDAEITTVAERLKIAIYWKQQYEELDAMIREHGALLGGEDFNRFRMMQQFSFCVGDILGLVMDTLQPTTLEALEDFGFDA